MHFKIHEKKGKIYEKKIKKKKKYFTSAVNPFVNLPQNFFFFRLMFFNHCRALVSLPLHPMTQPEIGKVVGDQKTS